MLMISETFFSSAASFDLEQPTFSAQVIGLCIFFALSRKGKNYFLKNYKHKKVQHMHAASFKNAGN